MSTSDWIAVVAVVVMIWSVWSNRKLQGRMTKIEEGREKDRIRQMNKAYVKAYLSRADDRLYFENYSDNPAKDLEVYVNGVDFMNSPVRVQNEDKKTRIGPKSEISYFFPITGGNTGPWEIKITWNDESGEKGIWEGQLSI
jgi:hypothetical protein